MNFGLIIVGDEILSGKRQDKHLPKVIELLGARGLQLSWAQYVGDDPQRLERLLADAFASGDTVFSCGGIGATPDDHTRQCAARALGVPLALHPEARVLILERVAEMAREQGQPFDPESEDTRRRLNMGVFPQGSRIIPNPYNRIPGFSLDGTGDGSLHFVPGFPVMAWPMIEWVLETHCAHLFHRHSHVERSVIVYGALEAVLTPLMEDLEARFAGVKVFSLPSVDHPVHGRHIELGVKGEAQASAAAYEALLAGLQMHSCNLGPELVR